jgi:hypothetical protein
VHLINTCSGERTTDHCHRHFANSKIPRRTG